MLALDLLGLCLATTRTRGASSRGGAGRFPSDKASPESVRGSIRPALLRSGTGYPVEAQRISSGELLKMVTALRFAMTQSDDPRGVLLRSLSELHFQLVPIGDFRQPECGYRHVLPGSQCWPVFRKADRCPWA